MKDMKEFYMNTKTGYRIEVYMNIQEASAMLLGRKVMRFR